MAPDAVLTLLNISENVTYAVDEADGTRSTVRVHRPGYHSRTSIESELAWVARLRTDAVASVPVARAAPSGEVVVVGRHPDGEERFVVRFEWLPGHAPDGAGLIDDFVELGAVAARLHRHARRWAPPAWFTRFRWDYATSVGPRGHWGRWQDGMAVGPAERAVLSRLAQVLEGRLLAFGDGPDRFGLVHADMRLANLIVDPGGRLHVIDFDDCGFGWFLYDLGASLSFIEHDPQVPELIAAWAQGYRTVAPLTTQEEAELPTFVLLRRLLLVAWIGSHAETDLAQAMGAQYTATSCDLAEAYLSRKP